MRYFCETFLAHVQYLVLQAPDGLLANGSSCLEFDYLFIDGEAHVVGGVWYFVSHVLLMFHLCFRNVLLAFQLCFAYVHLCFIYVAIIF